MMAVIPILDPVSIENPGRRRLYEAVSELPPDYTVLWGFQFRNQITAAVIWEADIIVVHPFKGFLVFQVVEGEVGFFNGRWHRFNQGSYRELEANPVETARQTMYQVVSVYREKYGFFPLSFDFGLCFPDCNRLEGQAPAFLRPDNLMLGGELLNFTARVAAIFRQMPRDRQDSQIIRKLTENILTVNFRMYNTLEEHIRSFTVRADLRFTDEQQRILDETDLNRRMVFFGAAGTGKTMLALEKARRLAAEGHKVLLTCFNRNLARQFPGDIAGLTAIHFHGLLEQVTGLRPRGEALEAFYERTLPEAGRQYFAQLRDDQKYAGIIVDEGQDFRPHWLQCLETALGPEGWYYVFADSSQNIFGVDPSGLETLPASRFRLSTNLRNTVSVCEGWIKPLSGTPMRLGLKDSGEIHFHSWKDDQDQLRLLEAVVADLTAREISPRRITILSPNRRENSCLAEVKQLGALPLAEVDDPRPDVIRFSTIRAFKGLEADVVLLIGVRPDSPVCSKADLYVGGSRARYALHVFHRRDWELK